MPSGPGLIESDGDMGKDITIYEVGPRDGLQSASLQLSIEQKVDMIALLADSGLERIEVGSFVHPKRVPNMADSDEVYRRVADLDCELSVLVPNKRGLERAQSVGATKFNVFLSPSNAFNRNNLNLELDEILSAYKEMLYGIPKDDIRVYISHAFGCPIEGEISTDILTKTITQSSLLGNNVVMCDTVGLANAEIISKTLELTDGIRANWALHLHHNYKVHEKIFDNVQAGYDFGIRQFDSSIAGLGGCPFSPGSGANLATEGLVRWAEKNNIDAGISSTDLTDVLSFVRGLYC